jgi:hypothetical protein
MRTSFTTLLAILAVVDAAAAQWNFRAATGPAATYDAVMAHDLVRSRCVLLTPNPGPQTWTYDGASWQQLQPAHTPPGRRGTQMVYDMGRAVTVLYGGLGSNPQSGQTADETWEWNGTDWQQVQPAVTPGGLANYAAAFDLYHMRLCLYGGRPNSWLPTASNATWEYDGVQWQRVITPTQPPALELASACFDVAHAHLVLFGGINPTGNVLTDDTWVYDGIDWTLLNVPGPRPAPRVSANLVYDLGGGVSVLFGGRDPVTMAVLNDTWTFDGAVWHRITDATAGIYPPRVQGAMTFDNTRQRMVYFGGRTASNATLDETWEYGASFRTFGTGCAGSNGVPHLASTQEPRFGSTYRVTLSNLPANPVAMMVTGIRNDTWTFGTLPMLLTSFGMPGCRAYVSADLLQVVPVSGGSATWAWTVPTDAALVGTPFYQQGIAIDPGVNAAGLTVSNAGASVIGH